ncbi:MULTISPECIES: hypothetical protein [Variovorax]|jgi:hypothetical protein|uniref:hypothetical protein n=1 Tax=Variovorax TaxID=34072 RepID=UPI0008943D48|nr:MULTISPECIES: hypothetical protein [unclassified Variovorax]SDW72429.1 hypothetical protein SAMN05518669_102166 [Variovorax sp. YR634]SEU10278.1 hypothetical protein SAMN05443580_11535 [Variovorax sp. OV084]
MNGHKIICGSLAGACVAGAIAMLARAHPAIAPPDLFFSGLFVFFVFVFLWAGWWDEAVNDNAQPSLAERTVATGWLWMRRLVCWGGAFVCLLIAASMFVEGIQPGQVPAVVLAVSVGGVLIWAGLKGFGRVRGMSDDAAVHAERRKRYGWWF